jgi:hypothetical protein
MAANPRSKTFKTPLCRLSFAGGLFKAKQVNNQGAVKFSATLIFPLVDRKILEPYVREVIVEKWGEKGLEKAKAGIIRSPFLAGDGKEARNKTTGEVSGGLGPDVFFIRVQAGPDRPPFVTWKDPNVRETEEFVYSGCYGKAVLNAFAWHNDTGGDGVSFGIDGFQKLKEGERLGGERTAPDKYHETVEDVGDAPTETRDGRGASALFGD